MEFKTKEDQINFKEGALLLIDKPLDWTSFDVVNKVRYKIRHRYGVKKFKVGHAGTLDPKATGLLLLCTGKFTKKLADLQGLSKTYTGTIKLGATTPTMDTEMEEDAHFPTDHIDATLIEETRKKFIGEIDQFPPMFSAIKVDGIPLYKRARNGESIEVKSRKITIHDFQITRFEKDEVDFIVSSSKGTYIRSLAYDFGKALGSGAYLTALRRTKVETYDIKDAWQLDDLITFIEESPKVIIQAS